MSDDYMFFTLSGVFLGLIISFITILILQKLFGDNRHSEYEKFDLSYWIIFKEYGGNDGFSKFMRSNKRFQLGYMLTVEFEDNN